MWLVVDGGTYAHIFTKLEKQFKMMGKWVQWVSICGRSFATKEPQPNPKKKKCVYCVDKENGHHAD